MSLGFSVEQSHTQAPARGIIDDEIHAEMPFYVVRSSLTSAGGGAVVFHAMLRPAMAANLELDQHPDPPADDERSHGTPFNAMRIMRRWPTNTPPRHPHLGDDKQTWPQRPQVALPRRQR